MAVDDDPYSGVSLYGMTPQAPSYGSPAQPTESMGTGNVAEGWRGLVDPRNPLVWAGALILVTAGLAGVAGSVRLGRARVSLDAGA